MKALTQAFFAIPCGIFYDNQHKIIRKLCKSYNIEPVINEIDYMTDSLLNQIFDQITKCDYFIADISSNSPNVLFELGYAFRAKHRSKIAILLSNISKCPSDLQDIKRLQYGNYREFTDKLNNWIGQFHKKTIAINDSFIPIIDYYETFKDYDNFIKRWDFPLGCDYSLTYSGFRFSNAHIPIISRHLAYLDNYCFEFDCLINSKVIGWIINGTKFNHDDNMIDFCIMFNLNVSGNLTPHILSKQKPEPGILYKIFNGITIKDRIDFKDRLTIKTTVKGSVVSIDINGFSVFQQDFTEEPFANYYNSITPKTNEVGFRCHPGEVATLYSIKVYQNK